MNSDAAPGFWVGSAAKMWMLWGMPASMLSKLMVKAVPAGAARQGAEKATFWAVSLSVVPLGEQGAEAVGEGAGPEEVGEGWPGGLAGPDGAGVGPGAVEAMDAGLGAATTTVWWP